MPTGLFLRVMARAHEQIEENKKTVLRRKIDSIEASLALKCPSPEVDKIRQQLEELKKEL